MTWSLLNVSLGPAVEQLMKHESIRQDEPGLERMLPKEKCEAIIHAALWAYSCRSDSFAGCYAMDALFNALELKSWTFKEQPETQTVGQEEK